MDSLSVEQHNYDWDNISVGCTQLDHSENFFARKHFEHERWNEIELLQQRMIKAEISEDKENIPKCSSPADVKLMEKEGETRVIEEKDVIESPTDNDKQILNRQDLCGKTTANLAGEWSAKKNYVITKGAVTKNMLPPPHAYLIKDIYQRKREEAERRRAEEERRMREFHARPAPLFNNDDILQKRKPFRSITTAITPKVLKKSRETEEKRRKKLEEWKQKHQPPKFESRQPTVLKEKPFVPEKKTFVLHQHPFNLQTEKRLQERRHYDEIRQKAMEEKRKQEDEERERIEKERIRELRKATTFKARPNPFKN